MKKVSIIVATYNQAKYLPVCLDSIWFQEYPEIEIVVVNDGSTDDTDQIMQMYAETIQSEKTSYAANYNESTGEVERCRHDRYPKQGRNLVYLRHEKNQGLSAALNTGFQACTGAFCTFIASDDMLLPGMVSDLMSVLEKKEADFAYADIHIVDDLGRILRRFSFPAYSFEDSFCRWYLLGVCKLYRRELHERFGYFDPNSVPQDHDMYLRFAMGGARFVHVPKVLANVRIHDGQRAVDNHLPANWSKLYSECAELVVKARGFNSEKI